MQGLQGGAAGGSASTYGTYDTYAESLQNLQYRQASKPVRRTRPAVVDPVSEFAGYSRGRPLPAVWRWPKLWAAVAGCVVQLAFGIFPSLSSLAALIAANPNRCPVAMGANGNMPFLAWFIGVVLGNVLCEVFTVLRNTSSGSWVVWGGIPVTFWAWRTGLDMSVFALLDPR